ncbi:MAG: hypothetical protein COA69_11800 [Robiginitomaculum sp.]|nr:MAG: hypothetical protein COA69_11800 [Robiginitomaculum sp.]
MKTRVLPVLGLLFAITLVSRTVALSSEVNVDQKSPAATAHVEKSAEHAQTDLTPDTAQQLCVTGEVLETINNKMERLKLRETEISEQETAFAAIEQRLKKQLAVVETAKNALAKEINERTELAKNDIVHLTTMYEIMKPKKAAVIFDRMDSKFAAGFLREMKSAQAGQILAAMDATKAYEISLVIASRHAKYRPRKSPTLP